MTLFHPQSRGGRGIFATIEHKANVQQLIFTMPSLTDHMDHRDFYRTPSSEYCLI